MTDTQVSTKTAVNTAKNVVLENPNGTSNRIVVYNRKDWDPKRDLSLTDLTQARAGMDAIAKWVAGGITGSAKLMIVAPTEKLGFDNATGTFAYVRNDYVPGVDAVELEIDGVKVLTDVAAKWVPNERGYRRLHLDGPKLYGKGWEDIFTSDDDDAYIYWRCRATSVILEGNNLSVSVGKKLLEDAQKVIAVVQSDDPAAANAARLYAGRVSNRFGNTVAETTAQITAELGNTNVNVSVSDLDVPLYGGGTINLTRYTATMPVHLVSASGMKLRSKYLQGDNIDIARLALARTIRDCGYFVTLQ